MLTKYLLNKGMNKLSYEKIFQKPEDPGLQPVSQENPFLSHDLIFMHFEMR